MGIKSTRTVSREFAIQTLIDEYAEFIRHGFDDMTNDELGNRLDEVAEYDTSSLSYFNNFIVEEN